MLAGVGGARAQDAPPDLTLRATPPAEAATPRRRRRSSRRRREDGFAGDVPWGFYRDRQGRVMQVSFDFGRRLWLGVGYAPHRTPTGRHRDLAGRVRLRRHLRRAVGDGRTRRRFTVLDGQVRLHSFGLDVTGFRYDLSHRYQHPLLRITTFVKEPERHDLYLNVGLYTEALHFEVAPRGIEGEQSLTLANLQATLDLWQSEDLRSYVRLRAGPGVEMRLGPWARGDALRRHPSAGDAGRERILMGQRAMQRLNFRLRGDLLRSATWHAQPLPGDWTATADAAYEAILHRDQRSAGVAALRGQRVPARRRARRSSPGCRRRGCGGGRGPPASGWRSSRRPSRRRFESRRDAMRARAASARRVRRSRRAETLGLLLLLAAPAARRRQTPRSRQRAADLDHRRERRALPRPLRSRRAADRRRGRRDAAGDLAGLRAAPGFAVEVGLLLRGERPAPGWDVHWKRNHEIAHLRLHPAAGTGGRRRRRRRCTAGSSCASRARGR